MRLCVFVDNELYRGRMDPLLIPREGGRIKSIIIIIVDAIIAAIYIDR